MTTFVYLRVSTDQQDVENQFHGVMQYANRIGFEMVTRYEDTASSMKSWRERGLNTLIENAQPKDVLIVSEISRLARSTLQVLEILQECTKRELIVHVAKNNMIMDGSLNSKITAVVLGLAAEIEREFISARTTEALAKRKAAGLPLGRPKGSTNHTKKLDKRKDEIKDMLAKGVHKVSIAKIVDCSPTTLYEWMEKNELSKYIKSDKPMKAKAEEVKEAMPKNGLKLLNRKKK